MSEPTPDPIKTEPGVMTEVAAPFDAADTVRWWASAGLQLRPCGVGDKTALVAATAPGTYTLLVWAALGGKPTAAVEYTVIVGDATPARKPWRFPRLPAFPSLPGMPSLGKIGDVIGPALLALALLYGVTHYQGCSLPPMPWVNPTPAPIPQSGLFVLVIHEPSAVLPAEQQAVIDSTVVRSLVRDKKGQIRVFAPNADLANESKLWQDAMKRPRQSLPWLIVSNGKTGIEGPLPANVDDAVAIIKKYAGE
jgi:hypothetical protein